jgi:molecular chaperone GrpE
MWRRKGANGERKTQDARHKTQDIKQEEETAGLESWVLSPESNPDVFEITEEPEEAILDTSLSISPPHAGAMEAGPSSIQHQVSSIDDMVDNLESLRAEILKLGKAQIQARMFAESEYRALREAIEGLLADDDHVAETVLEDLFSIADGLEAGVRAGNIISSPEIGSWLDGMKIIHQRVMELLEKFDIYPVYSVGKPFDPSLHVAVAVEHLQQVDDNIILEEQRRGYARGDKVIRYAEVVVNRQPSEFAVQVEENDLGSPSTRTGDKDLGSPSARRGNDE